jgi:hypothetical protein
MQFHWVRANRRATRRGKFQFQFYFRLGKYLGTGEEEELRSDNQEEDDIDGAGEVEHRDAEKRARRRYMVVVIE